MFAQKNYPQQLGNSHYTIAEAGCLLTAICNGLEKLNGTAPDPPTLDLWFSARGDFIYDKADNASDDLAANSITKYDPTIVNTATGSSAVPPSSIAIVRFNYDSVQTGAPISHYCWVDHIDGSGVWIIDSWDGLVKSPAQYESVYHLPVAWFTFVKNVPAPTPPPAPVVTAPPAAPVAIPGNSTAIYEVIKTLLGFSNATDAANQTNAKGTVAPKTYFVYNTYPKDSNLINVTKIVGQPGSWINKLKNVPDPEPVLVQPGPITDATEAKAPTSWEDSQILFPAPVKYVVNWEDTPVLDGATLITKNLTMPDGSSAQYEPILIVGTVTKNNIQYYRRNAGYPNIWALIPKFDAYGRAYLTLYSSVYDADTTIAEKAAMGKKDVQTYITKGIYSIEKVFDVFFNKPKKG